MAPNMGQERIWAPPGPPNAASPWGTSGHLNLCFSVTTFGKSAFLATEAFSTLIQATLSPSPLSLSLSCNPSASPLSVLSYFCPLLPREWMSGSYSITPLSL